MKRILKDRSGVALMLVLAAITVLTAMGIEFAYNTNVNYHLASNERDRLQAYYLAKSAYNFMLLELKFDKVFQDVVKKQNLGQYLGANAQLPLCQQFPMSTGLIRAVFTGGLEGMMGAGGEEEVSEDIEEQRKDVSLSQEQGAKEFLQFEGDFDGECVDESTKIDLNGFAGLSTSPGADGEMSQFDQYKQFLFRFLSKPEFELLFERADVRVTDVITNIGDWVDKDTQVSEFGGKGAGAEQALYERSGAKYSVRNGKLITPLEVYLIDGVVDTWYAPLQESFTIYGDGKINVCTSNDDIVESVIQRYVDSTPGLPPLRLEDPEEMERLMTAVYDACASGAMGDELKQQLTDSMNTAIGAISEEFQPQQGQAGSQTGFGSYVSTGSRFFTLKLAGQVLDTTVRIRAAMDVGESDPKKWKLLYWRVY